MIARVWKGWTEKSQSDAYENLLRSQIFPGILAKISPVFSASTCSGANCRTKPNS